MAYERDADDFIIRSWSDPTLQFGLCSLKAFEELYADKGFYIATGPHADSSIRAAREALAAAAPPPPETPTEPTAPVRLDGEPDAV